MAQKFKKVGSDGEVTGGPVYYIQAAFKDGLGKALAGIFAVLIVFALGFMGNGVQSNSIAAAFNKAFGVPQLCPSCLKVIIRPARQPSENVRKDPLHPQTRRRLPARNPRRARPVRADQGHRGQDC